MEILAKAYSNSSVSAGWNSPFLVDRQVSKKQFPAENEVLVLLVFPPIDLESNTDKKLAETFFGKKATSAAIKKKKGITTTAPVTSINYESVSRTRKKVYQVG